jgi:ribosomal protein L10
VVGTQLVLEALGEILLNRLDTGLERHGVGLQRLRRLLRAQEAAHHAFGVTEIAALAAATPAGMAALRARQGGMRALAQDMIEAASSVLQAFELSPADIGRELDAALTKGLAA